MFFPLSLFSPCVEVARKCLATLLLRFFNRSPLRNGFFFVNRHIILNRMLARVFLLLQNEMNSSLRWKVKVKINDSESLLACRNDFFYLYLKLIAVSFVFSCFLPPRSCLSKQRQAMMLKQFPILTFLLAQRLHFRWFRVF